MNEELRKPLSEEQVTAFLLRIGLPAERKAPSAAYLDELIKAHLRTVPFDDADVWAYGAVPSLATDDLFDKIVSRRRGGYCFELNLLFWRLLQGLGFDAYPVIIHLGRPGGFELGVPAHCGLVVTVDGLQRFADIGFGGPVPDGSVPLDGTETLGYLSLNKEHFTIVARREEDGSLTPRFTFKNIPCDPVEIVPLNFHVARREGSGFAAALRMNLRLDDGFAEIGGQSFRFKKGDTLIEREIASPEEAKALARDYFGVPDLPVRDF